MFNLPVLDDFNRADGGLGSNWTAPVESGQSTPVIFSNVVTGVVGVYNSAYWNPTTFGPDCAAYATIPVAADDMGVMGVWLKMGSPGGGSLDGYLIQYHRDNSVINTWRVIDNSFDLRKQVSVTITAGDICGGYAYTAGGDIVVEAHRNTGSGYVMASQVIEVGAVAGFPALAGSGNIGFVLFGRGVADVRRSIDSFGGGTVTHAVGWLRA